MILRLLYRLFRPQPLLVPVRIANREASRTRHRHVSR